MTTIDAKILKAEGDLNRQIQAALTEFRTKLIENMSPTANIKNSDTYDTIKQGPEKVFHFRQSLLTIMFEIRDFKTLYNMAMASFIILTLALIHEQISITGEPFDFQSLNEIFKGTRISALAWIIIVIMHYGIILVTKIALRTQIFVWLPIYIAHIAGIFWIAASFSKSKDMGFGSITIIMAEAIRMIMKGHSYFRTKLLYLKDNSYKDFSLRDIKFVNRIDKDHNQKDSKTHYIKIADSDVFRQVSKLTYFLFIPTLIYRDQYTLTPVRSIKRMLSNLINFFACVYYVFILYLKWCKPVIQSLQNNLSISSLASAVINLMLPTVFFLILGFFAFLHSWLNFWSEVTRFPDRAFYSDWWNSSEFGSYYRKWNIVVHDWLYYYIYIDLIRFFRLFKNKKWMAQLITFFISAIIHEFILYYALGFFYPILFILFTGPGIIFVQWARFRKISINLLFWLQMYLGNSIMFSLYLIECFARQKITDQYIISQWGTLSPIIPRTFYLGIVS